MDHFTIFQDFYRVIAEMTEEEIVSAISNGTYRETVEDVRRIFAEQGEKAANEKKIELPEITFSANYRGGRSNATLVKYLGYIVVDIDHQTQEALARILALAKKCAHTRIAFISPTLAYNADSLTRRLIGIFYMHRLDVLGILLQCRVFFKNSRVTDHQEFRNSFFQRTGNGIFRIGIIGTNYGNTFPLV